MKVLLLLLTLPLFSYGQITIKQTTKAEQKKELKEEVKVIKATVLQIQGTNKAGRPLPGSGDFYLKYDGDEHFVKITESKIKSESLSALIGKKAEFRLIERDGLWDTDDPNVQSRIGEYVAILEIIESK